MVFFLDRVKLSDHMKPTMLDMQLIRGDTLASHFPFSAYRPEKQIIYGQPKEVLMDFDMYAHSMLSRRDIDRLHWMG